MWNPPVKTQINPLTGKMETVMDWAGEVARANVVDLRRELRDMLAGNVRFHRDEFSVESKEEESLDRELDG